MFTRKRTLLFLTVMATGFLLSAAWQAAQPGPPASSTEASSGKKITIVIAEDPPSFNPMVADAGYDALVMELVMLGLTDVDPQGNVFPELAAELPTVENGGVAIDEEAGTMSVTWSAISDPDNGTWIPGSDYIESVDHIPSPLTTIRFTPDTSPSSAATIFPGLMIFLSIISVNYIGDGLREAFDPYKVLETVGEYT